MFHHFSDAIHPRIQGALTADQFENIITRLIPLGLIAATEWEKLFLSGKLKKEFCLTFDDNLKSQVDVALPVMLKHKLNAFFFIYTNPFLGKIERLELYRFYRNVMFESVDDFYGVFFEALDSQVFWQKLKKSYDSQAAENYYSQVPFYSKNDRIFRYLRDELLGEKYYYMVMDALIEKSDFLNHEVIKTIFFSLADLDKLVDSGNILGLHSQYHPTNMAKLTKNEQFNEYKSNFDFIRDRYPRPVVSMSHPSNSYNSDTIDILKSLGIKYGFRSVNDLPDFSLFELPRIDYLLIEKEFGVPIN